jgi:hypothetical protein
MTFYVKLSYNEIYGSGIINDNRQLFLNCFHHFVCLLYCYFLHNLKFIATIYKVELFEFEIS